MKAYATTVDCSSVIFSATENTCNSFMPWAHSYTYQGDMYKDLIKVNFAIGEKLGTAKMSINKIVFI